MDRIELLPGIFFQAAQTTRFKTACFSLHLLRPLRKEEAAKNALLANVLMRGTAKHPNLRSISAMLDHLYGASAGPLVRKNGEVQTCGFFMSFVEDRFALEKEKILAAMVDFLRELLLEPLTENDAFPADIVVGEKQNLINMIASEVNDKRAYADQKMLRAMFANDPGNVSRLGDIEDVQAITPADLFAHFQHILAHSKIEIFYSGSQSPETVAGLFANALAAIPRQTPDEVVIRGFQPVGKPQYLEETMDVTQAKLSMGFTTDCTCRDPEYPALVLFNAVFGAGVTSKLFINVREKLSLCYYASSSLLSSKGVLVVSSGIQTENYETAKAEILRQLTACQKGEISEEELLSAKKALCSSLDGIGDSLSRMEDFCSFRVLAQFPMSPAAYKAALEAVTVAEIAAAAQKVRLDTILLLKGAAK